MAISSTHARLLRSIKHLLPHGGTLLEIGEANWYCDEDPASLLAEIEQIEDEQQRIRFRQAADLRLGNTGPQWRLHEIVKAFYACLFAPREIVSVDMDGTPAALRLDLNDHIPHSLFSGKFDISINHGTAEHVFNIAQVFVTMHQHTKCGGLMVHESPFTGWIDHGFYCLQPTLFYDLAAANNYEIVLAAVEHIESGTTIRLESRDHAVTLASRGERWTPVSNGTKHAVIKEWKLGPPCMSQLESDHSHWVRAWCPSHELAKKIVADHNAACSELPNNSMLFVVFRKITDAEFRIPMQGYYAKTLSKAGERAWGELR